MCESYIGSGLAQEDHSSAVEESLASGAASNVASGQGVVIGTLIGFRNHGATPLVAYPSQPGTAAVAAESIVDLQGSHVGRRILLSFENGESLRPIVVGLMRTEASPLPNRHGQVTVDADDERLVVTAKRQLVLRCGEASITLTRDGKVLVRGRYVSNRSTGVMRIKGGSVQIN
jgi:hypothetical protein